MDEEIKFPIPEDFGKILAINPYLEQLEKKKRSIRAGVNNLKTNQQAEEVFKTTMGNFVTINEGMSVTLDGYISNFIALAELLEKFPFLRLNHNVDTLVPEWEAQLVTFQQFRIGEETQTHSSTPELSMSEV